MRPCLSEWSAGGGDQAWTVTKRGGAWATFTAPALKGVGEWTHQYASPGNTTCSRDNLVKGPFRLQWFGAPGPEHILDRHHRPVGPLSVNGRLFVQGDSRIIGVDAYNGTPLWQASAPDARRVAAQRDTGNIAASKDRVYYAVGDACWVLDAETGDRLGTLKMPDAIRAGARRWGCILLVDDLVVGSVAKGESGYREVGIGQEAEMAWDDHKRLVTSDLLFAVPTGGGDPRWTYKHGVVINSTISASSGAGHIRGKSSTQSTCG